MAPVLPHHGCVAGELEALLVCPTDEVRVAAARVDAALVGLDRAGLALLPITERLHRALGDLHQDTEAVLGFYNLTGPLADWAATLSQTTSVAYIHLEFHGGTGIHAAVGWRDGAICWGPRFTATPGADEVHYELAAPKDMAINGVLRWFGVHRGAAVDEFEAAGLARFRWTDQWEAAAATIHEYHRPGSQ